MHDDVLLLLPLLVCKIVHNSSSGYCIETEFVAGGLAMNQSVETTKTDITREDFYLNTPVPARILRSVHQEIERLFCQQAELKTVIEHIARYCTGRHGVAHRVVFSPGSCECARNPTTHTAKNVCTHHRPPENGKTYYREG